MRKSLAHRRQDAKGRCCGHTAGYHSSNSEELFAATARSEFRSRFKLRGKDLDYLACKGLDVVMQHAQKFLATRLFPMRPVSDGKQTPMRGHPVFVAQHATGTCCRKCLAKWHGTPAGRPLVQAEQERVLGVIRKWLETQAASLPKRPIDRQMILKIEN